VPAEGPGRAVHPLRLPGRALGARCRARHIRTTNPIESTFATVRHRSRQTKGCGWLNGYGLIDKVIRGVRFQDRVGKKEAP